MLSGSKDAVGKRELSDEEEELERDGKGRGGKGETEGQHGDKDGKGKGKDGKGKDGKADSEGKDGKGKGDRPEEKNDDKRSGGQGNRDANRDAEGKRERPERNGEGNHGNKGETEGKHGGKRGRGNHTRPEHSDEGKNGTKRGKQGHGNHTRPEHSGEGKNGTKRGKRGHGNHTRPEYSGDGKNGTKRGKRGHGNHTRPEHFGDGKNDTKRGKRGHCNHSRPEHSGDGKNGTKRGKRGPGNHTRPEHSGEGKNGTKRDAEDAPRQPEENREGMFDRGPGQDEGERVELQENTGKSDSSRENPRPNSPGQSADLGNEDNLRLTSLNNFISKSWNIGGTLDVSIGSSMEPAQVLQMFDQNRTLLEDAIARSHGYIKVVILGVDTSRRLRSATVTRIRVRFQAESIIPPPERVVPTQSDLSQTLQQSFAKAGLDFQVQSAAVVITSSEFSEPDRSEQNDVLELDVLFIAGGLIMLCSCVAMLCLCKRQHSRANNVPKHEVSANVIHIAPVVIAKSYDLSEKDDKDLDLASVSTGTPSSSKSDLSLF